MTEALWPADIGSKPAVINSETGQTLSFSELDERSTRLARYMQKQGLKRGDHVAVFLENTVHYFEVIFAAFRSGLYFTPVSRHLTAEEAGYIITDCEAKLLVTSANLPAADELLEHIPNCPSRLMIGDVGEGYLSYEDALTSVGSEPLDEEPLGAYMFYSSGTTGRPKGIVRPLMDKTFADIADVFSRLQRKLFHYRRDMTYLSPAPLYHSAPTGYCVATLVLGGTVVMMPHFDEEGALKAIEDHKVTHSQWVPTMFTRLLRLPEDVRAKYDLSTLEVAIHAAAPCPKGIKQQMFDWWGPVLYEYYGGSEMNGLTYSAPQDWLDHPGTVGKAVLGELHICDEEGNELPPGEAGLVYFEMPKMTFSYFKDKKKTNSAQHPIHPNWSALGDVGYVNEEGFLFLTDRATFMIISGGVNIYPQEIENAIILHDKVADVAVVGVPNEEMGEEVKAVVQTIPGIEGTSALEEELLAYTREHIAHYKCPRSIDFMEELPRLPTGKLYKRLLKDRYWGKTDTKIV